MVRKLRLPRADKSPRPPSLIATHMDAIGLMVSRIVDGFLYITNIGSVDSRVLPGTPVIVHASGSGEELYGVVVMPPDNLLPEEISNGAIALQYLMVDTGLTPKEVSRRVRIGDRVAIRNRTS